MKPGILASGGVAEKSAALTGDFMQLVCRAAMKGKKAGNYKIPGLRFLLFGKLELLSAGGAEQAGRCNGCAAVGTLAVDLGAAAAAELCIRRRPCITAGAYSGRAFLI